MSDKNTPRDKKKSSVARDNGLKSSLQKKVGTEEGGAPKSPDLDQKMASEKIPTSASSGSEESASHPKKTSASTPTVTSIPWGRLIIIIALASTWTLWLPAISPNLTQRIGFVQPRDLAHLSAKMTALETRYKDYTAPSEIAQSSFQTSISERLKELEVRVAGLSNVSNAHLSLIDPVNSEAGLFTDSTKKGPALKNASTLLKEAQEYLKKAEESFKKSEQTLGKTKALHQVSRERVTHFLKAFAAYEALETSVKLGEPFQDLLRQFSTLIGPKFEAEQLEILASFAALGLPAHEKLIQDSRLLLAIERSGVTLTAALPDQVNPGQINKEINPVVDSVTHANSTVETVVERSSEIDSGASFWSFSDQAYALLKRLTQRLKKMVTIRERAETPEGRSTLERLENVQELFQKGAFREGAEVLASIKAPSEKIYALLQHTLAYNQSMQALLKLKKHLYSPVFLETLWSDQQKYQEAHS